MRSEFKHGRKWTAARKQYLPLVLIYVPPYYGSRLNIDLDLALVDGRALMTGRATQYHFKRLSPRQNSAICLIVRRYNPRSRLSFCTCLAIGDLYGFIFTFLNQRDPIDMKRERKLRKGLAKVSVY